MNYDGYCSDNAVEAMDRRRQRRRREVCESFTCMSPLFMLRRWISEGRSSGSRNGSVRRNWGNLDVRRNLGIVKGLKNDEPQSSSVDVSEIGKETSFFNLGVGFGLIYWVAASRNELNKMVELQKDIRMLLRNFSRNHQDKFKPLSIPVNSTISSSFSNTAIQQTVCTEEHDSGLYLSSHDVQRVEIGIVSDRYRRKNNFRMDQIEEELDTEFDSLQVQMDEEFYLKYSQHKHSEMRMEESAPEWSHNTCPGEHSGHNQERSSNEYYSVPARELERKLHELLEARQQERINELETSLDHAMEQLGKKQKELSWWKDTARLIARRLPPVPNLVRQVKQGINGRHEELGVDVREMSRSMVMNSLFESKYENVDGKC